MTSDKELEISRKLVKLIDEMLDSDAWNASPILRTTKKRFEKYRHDAEELVTELSDSATAEQPAPVINVPAGYRKVFILLYQADGLSLQIWQNMLKNLSQHSVSRPVYASEEQIQEVVRSKPMPQRQAYAVVAVKEEDILRSTRPQVDNLGHELLLLRDNAIAQNMILEFVHANKKHYLYKNGILTPYQ